MIQLEASETVTVFSAAVHQACTLQGHFFLMKVAQIDISDVRTYSERTK